jgi:hypothetical protein
MIEQIGRCWLWAVIAAALCTPLQAAPSFTCETFGRMFKCVAAGVDDYSILPEWSLHRHKSKRMSYGFEFSETAPKQWTLIEMKMFPDDQSGAPYDGIVAEIARVWVRQCNGRAYFTRYFENVEPPACPKKTKR